MQQELPCFTDPLRNSGRPWVLQGAGGLPRWRVKSHVHLGQLSLGLVSVSWSGIVSYNYNHMTRTGDNLIGAATGIDVGKEQARNMGNLNLQSLRMYWPRQLRAMSRCHIPVTYRIQNIYLHMFTCIQLSTHMQICQIIYVERERERAKQKAAPRFHKARQRAAAGPPAERLSSSEATL